LKQIKKVLMVLYSYYAQDPRPRREIESLVKAGYQVDMICLRMDGQKKRETIHGCNLYRVNLKDRGNLKPHTLVYIVISLSVHSSY